MTQRQKVVILDEPSDYVQFSFLCVSATLRLCVNIRAMRKAKILATLGPASNQQFIIETMLNAGLNAVRINMSHGTQDEHAETIRLARAAAAATEKPLSILVDLSGPKIRTRLLENGEPIELKEGQAFVITTREVVGNTREVSTNFLHLPAAVEAGSRILLDDGAIDLLVESKIGRAHV